MAYVGRKRGGEVFEGLDYPTILPGMLRAAGDIGKTEFSQIIGDRALGTLNIEPLCNNLNQIDTPPAHDTVHSLIGAGLNDL